MAPSATEQHILGWLEGRRDAMLELLEAIVDIDSGSHHKPGVDEVGKRLSEFFSLHSIRSETIPSQRFGDALRSHLGADKSKPVLLMGHRDTVFPTGESVRRPFRIENGRAYGPGVADMKAGLVMNAFVFAAFSKFSPKTPLMHLCTGDEEIGSPFSRPIIEAEGRRARAVFNAEPGRTSGAVITGRKGGLFMRFDVAGKAAHSGANFEQGISAIEEIACKVIALHALTDFDKGVTVNVGTISGGQTVNTVAPHAWGEIDLRFVTPLDRDAAMQKIESIVKTSHVPGTRATLEIESEFLPFVETEAGLRLYRHYAACANEIGLSVPSEFTGGCADSGFTANVGTPTLCATGPIGARAHSPDEFVDVLSIVPRAQALALAIARIDQA